MAFEGGSGSALDAGQWPTMAGRSRAAAKPLLSGAFRSGAADARAPSETRLITEAQRGSEEAIEVLVRRHWPLAYRAAYLVVGDAAAAEDVAQEALMAAIGALDRFDRRRPFGPWLHRIAVNRAIDHARARAARAEIATGDAAETERRAGTQIDAGESDPRTAGLLAAIGELSPEQRAIVAMRFLLELAPSEIARELGIPRGTVNSRLRRTLDRLAERIEEGGR